MPRSILWQPDLWPCARRRLSAASRRRLRPFEVEAFAGQPFGVGRITFELPQNMLPEPLGIEGIGLGEKHGRVLYPALDNPAFGKMMKESSTATRRLTSGGPVREEVGGLLRGILDRPPRTTLYFLFRGDEPLELSLQARAADAACASSRATTPSPSGDCCNCGGSNMPGRPACSSRSPTIRRWSTTT